jgi:type III pantothenate kinase
LGDSTETALQSGLVIGAAAQAEGLVARIKRELGIEDATVVGTGGLARTVSAATDLFDAIDPDLTLRGIREIWLWQREHE